MREASCGKQKAVMKVNREERSVYFWHSRTNMRHRGNCFDLDFIPLDPKGGDLLVTRMKPREIVVEVRTGS